MSFLSAILAQAGGGGSFGSGGGSSGGGSGALGDGLVWLLWWLISSQPLIGIPVALLLLFLFVLGSRSGIDAHKGRVIRRGRSRRLTPSPASTAALTAGDPSFEPGAFLERARLAFRTAQDAWCQQDLERLRPFVSDGVFERFSLQVAEQREAGWRQGMRGLALGTATVAAVEVGPVFEALTVYLPFTCQISKLDAQTGKPLAGTTLPETEFAECWTFLRRRGTQTRHEPGLIEGQCPNCGAPLAMIRTARCETCGSEVLSGAFDWVLTEITQASVWQRPGPPPPSIAAYTAADPGLSTALLEDRASTAFWRLRQAEARGDVGPLLAIATPELADRLGADWSAKAARVAARDVAVGSVETLGLLAGEPRDRALVEVLWDASFGGAGRGLRRDVLVFGRRAGQETRWKDSFTTAHCQNCGGKDTGTLEELCPWCGEPRRGDARTWLLEDIMPRSSSLARELLAELESSQGVPARAPLGRQLLTWAASLAASDDELARSERSALASIAHRSGLSAADCDSLTPRELGLEVWQASAPPGAAAEPSDQKEARLWLDELVALALVDGKLTRAEETWLEAAARRLGFVPADLRLTIKKQKARLFRESRGR